MARSTLNAPAVLRAITAAAVVALLTASPASARPDPAASTGAASATAGCQAADLGISVPAAIAGDPDEGMGKRAWNIVFRNTSKAACSLRGWPRIAVRATGGKPVATSVSDVNYSNLAVVPDTEVILARGQSAIVTALSATGPAGCVAGWTLRLNLPGAVNGSSPVTVGEPAGSFAPCVGGQLRLSPFYAEQTLTREIKALGTSAAPPPFTADHRRGAGHLHRCGAAGRRHLGRGLSRRVHHRAPAQQCGPRVRAARGLAHGQAADDGRRQPGGQDLPRHRGRPGRAEAAHHLRARHRAEHRADPAARRLGVGRAVRGGIRPAGLPARRLAGGLPDRGCPRRGPHGPAGHTGAHLRRAPGPVVRPERPRRPGHGHRP